MLILSLLIMMAQRHRAFDAAADNVDAGHFESAHVSVCFGLAWAFEVYVYFVVGFV